MIFPDGQDFKQLGPRAEKFPVSRRNSQRLATMASFVIRNLTMRPSEGNTALTIKSYEFFLGGHDLEMVTIGKILKSRQAFVHDDELSWGATASTYRDRIHSAIDQNRQPVLIELVLDVSSSLLDQCIIIDHHSERSGATAATSIEQVLDLLNARDECWNRHLELIAANDRGHVRSMRAMSPPATDEEIREIRMADLKSQGATEEDLQAARRDTADAEVVCDGRLTTVRTTGRTGLIAEVRETFFGGPGFRNLLVTGQSEFAFFGEGALVERLVSVSPPSPMSWSGGALPEFGFWGAFADALSFDPGVTLSSWITDEPVASDD